MPARSSKHFSLIGLIFLGVLSGLLIWLLHQTWFNYKNMTLSARLMDQLLEYQAGLTRVHEYRSGMFKDQLEETRELVEKYRAENQQLLKRIQLQDEVTGLRQVIERLKEENKFIREQMDSLRVGRAEIPVEVPQVRSLKEARALIRGKKKEIRKIKLQIHSLKLDMVQQRIADQKEVDRVETMLGNHGYLVKDGEICSQAMALPQENPQVNIDVTFVP